MMLQRVANKVLKIKVETEDSLSLLISFCINDISYFNCTGWLTNIASYCI